MRRTRHHDRTLRILLASALALLLATAGGWTPAVALAETGNDASITANLTYTGDNAPEETFTVAATPLAGAPEPTGGQARTRTLSFHEPAGDVTFGFAFTAPGTYRYAIAQNPGTTPGVQYATVTYDVEFEVSDTGSGLTCTTRVAKTGEDGAKPAAIRFDNSYDADCPNCLGPGGPTTPSTPSQTVPASGTTAPATAGDNPDKSATGTHAVPGTGTDCPDCGDNAAGSNGDGTGGGTGSMVGTGGAASTGGMLSKTDSPGASASQGASTGSRIQNLLAKTGAALPLAPLAAFLGTGTALLLTAAWRRRRDTA